MKSYILTALFALSAMAATAAPPETVRLEAYPNPFSSSLQLTITPGQQPVRSFHLYDLIGKEVIYLDLTRTEGSIHRRIDVSNLPPGVYVAHVETFSGERVRQKVVKKS
ncbi:MAG: T9SS type A sorting domain-containing protein [Catalinimonas sp.]